jgi:hypothetical protein
MWFKFVFEVVSIFYTDELASCCTAIISAHGPALLPIT